MIPYMSHERLRGGLANLVIAQLLFLEHDDETRALTLHVDSVGGSVTASLAICDTMRALKVPVSTMCPMQATGVALLVLASGTQGQRFALERSRLSFAPLVASTPASTSEVERLERAVTFGFARATGQSPTRIRKACRESESFGASEAVRFGLIDEVAKRG